MDRETLYKFFEGAASYEEEVRIRQWMEHSPENRREFLKERKIFDSMLLLGDEKTIEEKMRHKSWSLSSLGTELIKIAAAVAVTLGLSLLYQFVSDKNGVVPMQSIYVPTGQRVNITLAECSDEDRLPGCVRQVRTPGSGRRRSLFRCGQR